MYCTKCGKSIPDESGFCPECGQDLRAKTQVQPQNVIEAQPAVVSTYESLAEPVTDAGAAPSAEYSAVQASYAAQQPKSSSEIGSKIGAFFKEYFKNPITAVASHAKQEFWLWGLISLCAYLLIHFLISLVGISQFIGFGYQFGYFIGDIARFATLIFAYYLFQGVFKLKKKSLTSIIAAVGLAFLPILPVYLVGLIFDRIFTYSSIMSGLMTAVYVVAGIILYSELKESSDDKDGVRSLMTIAVAIACMPIISGIIDVIVYRVMYLPSIFPYIY